MCNSMSCTFTELNESSLRDVQVSVIWPAICQAVPQEMWDIIIWGMIILALVSYAQGSVVKVHGNKVTDCTVWMISSKKRLRFTFTYTTKAHICADFGIHGKDPKTEKEQFTSGVDFLNRGPSFIAVGLGMSGNEECVQRSLTGLLHDPRKVMQDPKLPPRGLFRSTDRLAVHFSFFFYLGTCWRSQ